MNVLVIGDCHAPGMRNGYVEFLTRVANEYSVDRVIHIGDLVDWASISYHEKDHGPALANAQRELEAARKQVRKLHRAFPNVEMLTGNHDCLTERKANTIGLPVEVLKDFADLWEIPGWKVYPRFSKIELDGVFYSHGESGRGGDNAAIKQAKDHFRSTVIGHFHSQAGVHWAANSESRIFGLSVGCGIDVSKMQFAYGKRITAKPILGCGVVLGGKRAYFEPWLLHSRP